jgi:trimeric autotransporter adhesin
VRQLRLCSKFAPLILAILAAGAGSAQTLSVGTGSGPKGGTITVPVNLDSGASGIHPAALQWTLTFSATDFTGVTLSANGAAAAAAGKSVTCALATATTFTCLAAGITPNTIQDGVVATLTFQVSPTTASSASPVAITQASGAANDGSPVGIFLSSTSLTIVQIVVQNMAGLVCGPAVLTTPASAACTVTLTAPAPQAGITVSVSSDDGALTVPASVPVAAGSNTASFNAVAATVFANKTVHVTASVNSTSKTAALTLTALPVASGIVCSPNTVTGGTQSVCTVSLSAPARSGGTVVTLAGGTVNAVIPASVTVPSGATSNSFIVDTTAVAGTNNLNFSASAGGASVNTGLTLLAVTTISNVICTPGQLTPPGRVTCNVLLTGPAPPAGISVAMASSSASLPVPSTVPISAGATSGVFSTNTASVPEDTAAIVTATVGVTSRTSSVTLLGPASLAPLSCSPASFSPPGSTTCTINLTNPAPTNGGLIATVISIDPTISVPTFVPVKAGSTSATFAASVTAPVTASKSSTLYVAAAGVSTSTSITVLPPPQQVGLVCNPAAITTPGNTSCIVTIPQPAPPEGQRITLLADNSNVIIPPIIVPGGSKSVNFLITGTTVSSDVTATLSLPGVMVQSLTLLAPPGVSSLTCNAAALSGGSSTTCTVTMANPVRGAGLDVPLASSNTSALTLPALIHIPVGFTTVSFTVNALAGAPTGPVVITASGGSSSQSYTLAIRPHGVVTQVVCTPSSVVGSGSTVCQANLSPAAPMGGTTLTVNASSTQVFAPPTIQVPAGAQSAQFTVTAPLITQDESIAVTAALDGSAVAQLTLVALRPSSVSCAPKIVSSGSPVLCQVMLNSSGTSNASLPLSSSSALVFPPAAVVTQAGVASLTFQAATQYVTTNLAVTISASFQGVTASDHITLTPAPPVITAPKQVVMLAGGGTVFNVSATDPGGLAFAFSVAGLPSGAVFNVATGDFAWKPTLAQLGTYNVQIKATNLALASSTAIIALVVTTDHPVMNTLVNTASYVAGPACTPGGVATILGGGFTKEDELAATTFPVPTQLNGARLTVNGSALPLFYVSANQINFQCPNLPAGQAFSISFAGELGTATSQPTPMQYAAPGIFTADGSGKGQGAIVAAGSSSPADTPSAGTPGAPITPGDHISIYATGLGPVSCAVPLGEAAPADSPCPLTGPIQMLVGGIQATVSFAGLAPGYSGMYQVDAQVPVSTVPGSSVPVRIVVPGPGGSTTISNTVTIAVAAPAATP